MVQVLDLVLDQVLDMVQVLDLVWTRSWTRLGLGRAVTGWLSKRP